MSVLPVVEDTENHAFSNVEMNGFSVLCSLKLTNFGGPLKSTVQDYSLGHNLKCKKYKREHNELKSVHVIYLTFTNLCVYNIHIR